MAAAWTPSMVIPGSVDQVVSANNRNAAALVWAAAADARRQGTHSLPAANGRTRVYAKVSYSVGRCERRVSGTTIESSRTRGRPGAALPFRRLGSQEQSVVLHSDEAVSSWSVAHEFPQQHQIVPACHGKKR
jgi:hypothetical protein